MCVGNLSRREHFHTLSHFVRITYGLCNDATNGFVQLSWGVQLILGWDFRGSRGRLEAGWKSTPILQKRS